jgi:hypothetical protein
MSRKNNLEVRGQRLEVSKSKELSVPCLDGEAEKKYFQSSIVTV